MRGSIFVQLWGRSDRKWENSDSLRIYLLLPTQSFPWLPVSFEKYGALFGAIALSLLLNSAFQHYPLVLFQT